MEDLCKKQAEIIKLLTDAILINSKQEYIKSIKHICIAIITSFTILICFFVICISRAITLKKYVLKIQLNIQKITTIQNIKKILERRWIIMWEWIKSILFPKPPKPSKPTKTSKEPNKEGK